MSSRSPLQGFNHNVRHGARVYHVQTEDSGLDHPHVFTHLYYRGVIIASARADYSELAQQPGHEPAVRKMMQEQHKSLMRQLRHGAFDEKIAAVLGVEDAAPAEADASAGTAETDRVAEQELAEHAAAEAAAELVLDALPPNEAGAAPADALIASLSDADAASAADTQRIAAPVAQPPARAATGRGASAASTPIAAPLQPPSAPTRSGRGLEDALEWARGNSSAAELHAEPTLVQRIERHAPGDAAGGVRAAPPAGAQTQPRLGPDAEVTRRPAAASERRPPTGATPAVRPASATHQTARAEAGDTRQQRASGTYSIPTWARGQTGAPAPARPSGADAASVGTNAARSASTPQRYTAPSAKSSGRGRRATGSYSPVDAAAPGSSSGVPAIAQGPVAAQPIGSGGGVYRIATLGGARPSGAIARRGGGQSQAAVVARPAVVIDRAASGARSPSAIAATATATARPGQTRSTAVPPPSAVGMVPTKRPTASASATPSAMGHPRPFGADLISERSLDEVILQYLSEENDGSK
ncbi:MAG: hypothetical protein IPL40_11220 [Proteobacteria bacterium]|nr:hypothetical protein [Pseudomonadota bacterium]